MQGVQVQFLVRELDPARHKKDIPKAATETQWNQINKQFIKKKKKNLKTLRIVTKKNEINDKMAHILKKKSVLPKY